MLSYKVLSIKFYTLCIIKEKQNITSGEDGSDFTLSTWFPLTNGTSATSFSISDVFKPSGGSANPSPPPTVSS